MSNLIFNFFEPEFWDGFPIEDIFNPKFKSNWNHLMKVVEGLEEKFPYLFKIEITGQNCTITYVHNMDLHYFNFECGPTKIEATYNAIIDFLKWTEENNIS